MATGDPAQPSLQSPRASIRGPGPQPFPARPAVQRTDRHAKEGT